MLIFKYFKSALFLTRKFIFESAIYFFELSSFKYNNKSFIRVKYHKGPKNWGDDLNVYLIERIFNVKVLYYPLFSKKHLLGLGSILNRANKNSIIFGSGFISENSNPSIINKDSVNVRGVLSLSKLRDKNPTISSYILGDPGLCIRKYYKLEIEKKYVLGVIPHYVDKADDWITKVKEVDGVKILDIQSDIEEFIDELLQCDFILSTSLHGLIASISYDIPCRHIILSDSIRGGAFKFKDFYSGIEREYAGAIKKELLVKLDLDELIKLCEKVSISDEKIDLIINGIIKSYEN
ncbi:MULTISPECIES: polysaccharide pyruvyl transferase family protein [Vibrio]|uniref:polysaccharide pyruvyl transferase family protein n=2 Tax=Vibrionaceae TaxID=641 RepID=UPI000B5C85FF|nr:MULTISPECIES: polysaccharide pyruvyl transferase family protein [Vibrio]HBV76728.1 polysaccharide pyruvyl transferase family protein [Vibrio sp.]